MFKVTIAVLPVLLGFNLDQQLSHSCSVDLCSGMRERTGKVKVRKLVN